MSSFVPFPCTGKTSITCEKSIGEPQCQCQETYEKGLGDLDLSSLRRESLGDLRAVPLYEKGVAMAEQLLLLRGEVPERWNAGGKKERCRVCKKKLFASRQSSRLQRILSH